MSPIRADALVRENRDEGGAHHRLVLSVPGWAGFEPGQFAMLSAGARGAVQRTDPLLPRPMAIYRETRSEGETRIEVLYQVSGRGTALLAEALPGQRVGWVGPLGRAFAEPRAGERVVLVGGGTGIASLLELARSSTAAHEVRVLLGGRTEEALMGVSDFEALGIPVRISTEDGTRGQRGLVTELLVHQLALGGPTRVYACGPTPMMRACAALAEAADVPCVVSLENGMACGFGVCLGCAAPRADGSMALVCRDGPTFDSGSIAWERLP